MSAACQTVNTPSEARNMLITFQIVNELAGQAMN